LHTNFCALAHKKNFPAHLLTEEGIGKQTKPPEETQKNNLLEFEEFCCNFVAEKWNFLDNYFG
jgi:hypothetical protein